MKRIVFWGPPVVWMTVIFLLSSRQGISVSDEYILNFLVFKTLHVIEYAMLFTLNFRALKGTYPRLNTTVIAQGAFGITVLYAASDEFHQMSVPTREGALRDVIIDAFGAGIAWILILKLLPRAPGKLRSLAKSLHLL